MLRRTLFKVAAVVSAAGCMAVAIGSAVEAQERVRWKLASSYPSANDPLGPNIMRVIENLEIMSEGSLRIQFNEPGALVPALEVFDAVAAGSVDAAYSSPGFHQGKVPHLIFFAAVPFGPNVNEYLAWIQEGGLQ